jgi:hypothetical protein
MVGRLRERGAEVKPQPARAEFFSGARYGRSSFYASMAFAMATRKEKKNARVYTRNNIRLSKHPPGSRAANHLNQEKLE